MDEFQIEMIQKLGQIDTHFVEVKGELSTLATRIGTQNGRIGKIEERWEDLHDWKHSQELVDARDEGRQSVWHYVHKRELAVIVAVIGAIPAAASIYLGLVQ
jgi:hypothetical protein